LKKTVLTALSVLLLTVSVSACRKESRSVESDGGLSVTKTGVAGRVYEETSGGYRAAVYDAEEISGERVKQWIDACREGDVQGFTFTIESDPDSWDMFIYYPVPDGAYISRSFRFCIEDQTVIVYLESADDATESPADYVLIRVQAPTWGAWPTTARLYLDQAPVQVG